MPRVCKVCSSPKQKEIENEIINGTSHSVISRRFDIPYFSVRGHAENHLPKQLVKAAEKKDMTHSVDMLGRLNRMLDETERILQEGKKKGYANVQLNAIQQHNSTLELLARMMLKVAEIQEKKDAQIRTETRDDEIMDSLQHFSINELKCLEYLQCKASAYTKDWYDEPGSTIVERLVDKYGENPDKWPNLDFVFESDEDKERDITYTNKKQSDDTDSDHSKSRRNRFNDNKIGLNTKDTSTPDDSNDLEPEFDDLELDDDWEDDLDLELDDLTQTKDPAWLEEHRARRRKFGYDAPMT